MSRSDKTVCLPSLWGLSVSVCPLTHTHTHSPWAPVLDPLHPEPADGQSDWLLVYVYFLFNSMPDVIKFVLLSVMSWVFLGKKMDEKFRAYIMLGHMDYIDSSVYAVKSCYPSTHIFLTHSLTHSLTGLPHQPRNSPLILYRSSQCSLLHRQCEKHSSVRLDKVLRRAHTLLAVAQREEICFLL